MRGRIVSRACEVKRVQTSCANSVRRNASTSTIRGKEGMFREGHPDSIRRRRPSSAGCRRECASPSLSPRGVRRVAPRTWARRRPRTSRRAHARSEIFAHESVNASLDGVDASPTRFFCARRRGLHPARAPTEAPHPTPPRPRARGPSPREIARRASPRANANDQDADPPPQASPTQPRVPRRQRKNPNPRTRRRNPNQRRVPPTVARKSRRGHAASPARPRTSPRGVAQRVSHMDGASATKTGSVVEGGRRIDRRTTTRRLSRPSSARVRLGASEQARATRRRTSRRFERRVLESRATRGSAPRRPPPPSPRRRERRDERRAPR